MFWGAHAASRAGFGVAPKRTSLSTWFPASDERTSEKFAIARTRSPARQRRALPRTQIAILLKFAAASR